jgi:chitin synthase
MDSYSWGQTRTIEGDGKDKKMLVEADDYFEDSMIPLERFQGESTSSPRLRIG